MNIITFLRRVLFVLQGKVVHLSPQGTSRGNVLISYTTLPFLDRREKILAAHTNRWECRQMAQIFLDLGYTVDVIDFENKSFELKKPYSYFIDVGSNMERIGPTLGASCTKIYHAT
ncbi:MAG: glycosyltransferase family 1 protein, partial [Patescibacteria group bacterium]